MNYISYKLMKYPCSCEFVMFNEKSVFKNGNITYKPNIYLKKDCFKKKFDKEI